MDALSWLSLNMLQIGLLIVFGFLYFMFNEFEDECVRNNFKGRWAWLNQRGSWKRKWKTANGETIRFESKHRRWYYFGIYPENVERFPFSSTIFVFLTDPEHSLQFLKNLMIIAALASLNPYLAGFFYPGIWLFGFIKERFLKNVS